MAGELVLTTFSEVRPGNDEAFNNWYNTVHLPEILQCPGFIKAIRYECANGGPRYLATYDIETPDALSTPEMRRVHGWGPMQPHMRTIQARTYRRIFALPEPAAEVGDGVVLVTLTDVAPGAEAEFHKWYNDVHLPEIVDCPGFLRAARFESLEGDPRFLAIYDIESEEALTSEEFLRVRGWGPMAPFLRTLQVRAYRKTLALP